MAHHLVYRPHLEVVKELVWEMNENNGHMQNQQTQTQKCKIAM